MVAVLDHIKSNGPYDDPHSTECSQSRAGTYVRQQTGYRAFVPSPLPPSPPVDLTGSLQLLLSEADLQLGRLDGAVLTLPNPDLFVYMYVRKEAVLSSQIEGTQSSLQDLLAAEAQVLTPENPRDVAEVVNYARRVLALREADRAKVTQHLGRPAGNGHRVLERLYEHPIVSVGEVRELTGTTFPAANQLVGKLVGQGTLTEFTQQKRHRRFRYDAYIRLFTEPEPSTTGEDA